MSTTAPDPATLPFPPAEPVAHPALRDPWAAALDWGPGTVMALLVETRGPAYRDIGAAMAIAPDGRFAGAITSGCVEADLILQAAQVRAGGGALRLRYGEGSPFFDLRLPCGGGITVMLFALGDCSSLQRLQQARADRRPVSLAVTPGGALSLGPWRQTADCAEAFHLGFPRPLRLVIFGAGPEAMAFAAMVAGLGHDHLFLSHESALLAAAATRGCRTRHLSRRSDLEDVVMDQATAVVLFYHDHDYEPEILRHALHSPAFWIGAQGSRATQAARLDRLRDRGVPERALARLRGPIGLLPSSRDPQTLAVSVLAEIVAATGAATPTLAGDEPDDPGQPAVDGRLAPLRGR